MPPSKTNPAGADTADPVHAGKQHTAPGDGALAGVHESSASFDPHGTSLGILAVLASIFALSWAQNFVVPLLLGVVISYRRSVRS